MTKWMPRELSSEGPRYRAVADALERDVESGRLARGERLPTHRELARALSVNVVTVTRAYAEAARRGLVEGEVGRGTFVRGRTSDDAFLPVSPGEPGLIDFHFNLPAGAPALDPAPLLRALAKAPARAALGTGYVSAGLPEHRAAGAAWIARSGLEADPERTLVCVGGQHAMSVSLSALLEPGEPLLVEELTYPGLKALAGLLHVRLVPVAMDGEGLLPDAVDEAARKSRAHVLYCTPTLHNPTGTVLSEERRAALAAVARERDLSIVEDDTTGFLCADAPPPIATFAPERTHFLTSTTKSLAGGLRIGYLLAPRPRADDEGILERLTNHLAATTWMAPPLMAEIAATWIRDGTAERAVLWKRERALERRRAFDRALGPEASASHPSCPSVWIPLAAPWRPADFVQEARRRGVALAPAETFVVGRAPAPHAVRACLATPGTEEEVERGLEVLGELMGSPPRTACTPIV